MTQAELLDLLARAKAEGWKELNLVGRGIEELPPEIGQLSQLTTLYLSENRLSSVPAEIGQLSQLTTLYLGGKQLGSLPSEIG
jgi:Leucine-rich repeat (LRR) protein